MSFIDLKNKLIRTITAAVLISLTVISASADEHLLGQTDKAFDKAELSIKVGETVSFPNNDPYFHNVYSLSDAKFFDLGSYEQGETKKVTFDKAGVVDVECAIHPTMKAKIVVQE